MMNAKGCEGSQRMCAAESYSNLDILVSMRAVEAEIVGLQMIE
jgi:hypothetical protein